MCTLTAAVTKVTLCYLREVFAMSMSACAILIVQLQLWPAFAYPLREQLANAILCTNLIS